MYYSIFLIVDMGTGYDSNKVGRHVQNEYYRRINVLVKGIICTTLAGLIYVVLVGTSKVILTCELTLTS